MSVWSDHVLPHGPLQSLGPKLWQVVGRLKRGSLTRNMVVHKLGTGGLLVHSVVALDDKTLQDLLKLGKPEIMVVPCAIHRLDAAAWKERFPTIQVVAPKAARAAVEKVVTVDGLCEDVLPPHGIVCHAADGLKPFELCYELDSGNGKALVVTDMLFNLPHGSGLDGFIMKLIGSTGFFGMTFIGRKLMLRDRAAFKAWLIRMAALPNLKTVCVAHGEPVTSQCGERLRSAAARL